MSEPGNSKWKYLLIVLIPLLVACNGNRKKPLVVYVNSYHQGYPPSDQTMQGVLRTLDTTVYDYKAFFLDGKRLPLEDQIATSEKVASAIFGEKPDVLIVSDDHAIERIIIPHRGRIDFPVVFCGVNWSSEQYNFPPQVTGMIEVLPLTACIEALRNSVEKLSSITVLSENSSAEEKNRRFIVPMLEKMGLQVRYVMVDDFEAWKQNFLFAQQNTDVVFVPTNGAIRSWEETEAKAFVAQNIHRPVFTCDDFMMAYASLGFTKVAAEQGEWAANTAMAILSGQKADQIPLTHNKQSVCWINEELYNKTAISSSARPNDCKKYPIK